jgi:hypothetical protein
MGTRLSTATTGAAGALLFLAGTVLHPDRDGHGVAAAGHAYGITHAVQAIGLALLALALANLAIPVRSQLARNAAMAGTLAWLALIVYDGAHNPVVARYAPELVHTPADLDPGGALLAVPALVLFPGGYALLATVLARSGARWTGLLLGAGAITYWAGGLLIFAVGPHTPFIQILEVIGAGLFALGFTLLSRPVAASRAVAPAATGQV